MIPRQRRKIERENYLVGWESRIIFFGRVMEGGFTFTLDDCSLSVVQTFTYFLLSVDQE